MSETAFYTWPVDPGAWRDVRLPFERSRDDVPAELTARIPCSGALQIPGSAPAVLWRSWSGSRLLEFDVVPHPRAETSAIRMELPGPLTAVPVLGEGSTPDELQFFLPMAGAVLYHVRIQTFLPPDDLDAHHVLSKTEIRLKDSVTALQVSQSGGVFVGLADSSVGHVASDGTQMTFTGFLGPDRSLESGHSASTAGPSFLHRFKTRRQGPTNTGPALPAPIAAIASFSDDSTRLVLTVDTRARLRLWSPSLDSSTMVLKQEISCNFILAQPDINTSHPSPPAFMSARRVEPDKVEFFFAAMIDEKQFRPSFRISRLTAFGEAGTMAKEELAQISGDEIRTPVVAALPLEGSDFVVALRCGRLLRFPLSGGQQVSAIDEDLSRFTSAIDTLTESKVERSLWALLDEQFPDRVEVRLFPPGRFSGETILRALRRPDVQYCTQAVLRQAAEEVIHSLMGESRSRRDAITNLVARATRLAVETDMPITAITPIAGSSSQFIVARQARFSLVRQKAVWDASEDEGQEFSSAFLWCEAPAALLQGIGSLYLKTRENEDQKVPQTFLATIHCACTISERDSDLTLVDLATASLINSRDTAVKDAVTSASSPRDVVRLISSLITPGAKSLIFLLDHEEFLHLTIAAAKVVELLPSSANFAAGVSALHEAKRRKNIEEQGDYIVDTFNRGLMTISGDSSDEDLRTLARMIGHDDIRAENLLFWCRERIVRLYQAADAPLLAAVCAMDALKCAQDRKEYEMMRSAAFNFFLEAKVLESALKTLMMAPYGRGGLLNIDEEAEDSLILRDAISLLVFAAADQGRMSWLISEISPSGRALVSWSLRKRATTTALLTPTGKETSGAYEDAFAWLVGCGDTASAAAVALEWVQRLETESSTGRIPAITFLRSRIQALTAACSAVSILPAPDQWLGSYPKSIRPGGSSTDDSMTDQNLDNPWELMYSNDEKERLDTKELRRRLILSQAQLNLVERLAEEDGSWAQVSSGLLDCSPGALEWCIGNLCNLADFHTAADVALAWGNCSIGEQLLRRVIRDSGAWYVGRTPTVADHRRLVEDINRWRTDLDDECSGIHRLNYFLDFLDGFLTQSSGQVKPPKWLLNCCAFRHSPLEIGNDADNCTDLGATIRLLLRFRRANDASELLVEAITPGDAEVNGSHIPHGLVDATIDQLSIGSGDNESLTSDLLRTIEVAAKPTQRVNSPFEMTE